MAPLEAINIENSILGSIILDNTLAYKLDELSKDMFSVSYNKEIFEIMNYLHKNNYTLDIPTIKTKLDERKVDVMISYISNLSAIGETYAIDTHINILKDKFKRKCIKNSCINLITEIVENKDIDSCPTMSNKEKIALKYISAITKTPVIISEKLITEIKYYRLILQIVI